MYFAKKQEIRGLGGIYGQRAREVLRPFCTTCDIEGLQKYEQQSYWPLWRVFLIISGIVLLLLGIFLPPLAIAGILVFFFVWAYGRSKRT